MGTVNDTTTTLNPGTGGDAMDESAPSRFDGAVLKRPRVVIAGDGDEDAVVDLHRSGGVWCLPVSSPALESKLDRVVELLEGMNRKLAKLSNSLE